MSRLVTVHVYGATAQVNPGNPNFDFHTRRSNPYIETFAIIGNEKGQWREKFKVSSMSVAEEQIKEVIKFYNDTITSPHDKPRHFVELYHEDEEVTMYKDDAGMSGWLDPDGVFHPCGFGEHVKYALEMEEKLLDGNQAIDTVAANQHIAMSVSEQSSFSHIGILADLTSKQIEWFNRFFYKLSPAQRTELSNKAKEQGIQLKYMW